MRPVRPPFGLDFFEDCPDFRIVIVVLSQFFLQEHATEYSGKHSGHIFQVID